MAHLDYSGHIQITFGDASYRFISIKRFAWNGIEESRSVLASLIGDPHYGDHYLSPDSHEQLSEGIHGPYRTDGISPDCFDPVDLRQAEGIIDEFCGLYSLSPPAAVAKEIDEIVLDPVRAATDRYKLKNLSGAEHEFSFVLGEFRELVVISEPRRELHLIVMAVD